MKIVSQNLTNYNIPIPTDAIFRINLAWVNNLAELESLLQKHDQHEIFLDLPINRTKPPNNSDDMSQLIPILNAHQNVRYFAISNVNYPSDIADFINILPRQITIVPKIESPEGVQNIDKITASLPYAKKVIMLDHDDLYSALTKKGEPPSSFKDYFNRLVKFCNDSNIVLLRTIGVIFSDEEKRVSQYIK